MNNNDILRRLRYAFDFSNKEAIDLFGLDPSSTAEMSIEEFTARLAKEDEEGFVACGDAELAAFLDGLIVSKRGLRVNTGQHSATSGRAIPDTQQTVWGKPADFRLTRNDILKKLRIAMNFREPEMLATLESGGSMLSKAELGALFRNPKHKHYRACGNQVLRNFIRGLTKQLRA